MEDHNVSVCSILSGHCLVSTKVVHIIAQGYDEAIVHFCKSKRQAGHGTRLVDVRVGMTGASNHRRPSCPTVPKPLLYLQVIYHTGHSLSLSLPLSQVLRVSCLRL